MYILKLYEGFIEDQENIFEEKKKIINYFLSVEKYGLKIIMFSQEIGDYFYDYLNEDKKLIYEDTETKEKFKTNIFDVPIERLRELEIQVKKARILTIGGILEMYQDMNIFINILKNYKGKIENPTAWYFLEKVDEEDDENDTGNFTKYNTFEFQDLLLTNHPYMIDAFIDAINSKYNTGKLDNKPSVPIKINEKAKKKHKKVFEDYVVRQNIEKFNI